MGGAQGGAAAAGSRPEAAAAGAVPAAGSSATRGADQGLVLSKQHTDVLSENFRSELLLEQHPQSDPSLLSRHHTLQRRVPYPPHSLSSGHNTSSPPRCCQRVCVWGAHQPCTPRTATRALRLQCDVVFPNPPLSRRGVRHPLVPIGPFPCAWLELASVKSFSWAPLYCVWTTRGERVQGRSLRVNQGDEPRNFSLRCASVAVSSEQQCTQQRESSIGLVYTVQEARG